MSSASSPASKHRYDITMSRRTRKQLAKSEQQQQQQQQAEAKNKKDNNNNGGNNSINGNNRGVVSLENLLEVKEGDEEDGVCEHKSLKQLINGDHNNHHHNHHNEKMKKKDHSSNSGNNNKGGIRSSLGQHFNNNEEENSNNNNKSQQQQLQVVRRNSNQKESVQEGLKFNKLVRRYAKILGQHLIMKPKRDLNHFPAAPDHSTNKPFFKLSK